MSVKEGIDIGRKLGLPVLVRPSYVLGGQGMKICSSLIELEDYLVDAFIKDKKNPVLIDKYIVGKELEVDAITDGKNVLIPGIMEHIERAGIHSGDSMTVFPPQTVSDSMKQIIVETTETIALRLGVIGMINIQYIECEGILYVIEVNPRASRTVPYISKVSGVPIVDLATKVSLGMSLKTLGYGTGLYAQPDLIAVKVPVFSTHKLPDVEISLGPEMKSTGEVLGIGKTYAEALYKGFIGAKNAPDIEKSSRKPVVLMTLNDEDKSSISEEDLPDTFDYCATRGTGVVLLSHGVTAIRVRKIGNEPPNLLDLIKNGDIDLIVNTPTHGDDTKSDGFIMRRAASERNIPVFTSIDTYRAWNYASKIIFSSSETDIYNMK